MTDLQKRLKVTFWILLASLIMISGFLVWNISALIQPAQSTLQGIPEKQFNYYKLGFVVMEIFIVGYVSVNLIRVHVTLKELSWRR